MPGSRTFAIVCLIGGAAAALGTAFAAENMVVSQRGKVFAPGEVALGVGDTLQIANDDEVLHHVYIEHEVFKFDSGEQPPGRTIEIRFTTEGSFTALCAIHPKMKLKVAVQ